MTLFEAAAGKLDTFRSWLNRERVSDDAQILVRAIGSMNGGTAGGAPDPDAPANGYAVAEMARSTTTGTIVAGALFASFQNAGGVNAEVAGTTLKAGETVSFPTAFGLLLPEISYDATGTDLLIASVRPPAV